MICYSRYARTVSCVLPLSGALPSGGYTVTVTVTVPPTRARVLLAAVVSVGITFERPPAEESSARAERLSRLVDVLTVLKGRLFPADNVTLSPTTFEFYGWPPMCSPASA